jgi:hypothetical protein
MNARLHICESLPQDSDIAASEHAAHCAFLAATVSTNSRRPNGEGRAELGSVIVLSAEDDAADTIIPRLTAHGARTKEAIELRKLIRRLGSRCVREDRSVLVSDRITTDPLHGVDAKPGVD